MAENPRVRRLADRIHEVVARMLDTRVKDPRLGFVTVTDVRVTGDLQHADVYYTVLGDDAARAGSAAALASATGLIRSEVGRATGLRLTPTLAFHLDAVPESAAQIEAALAAAARQDAQVAALAAGASYAGEADPYRRPADEDEDQEAAGAAAGENDRIAGGAAAHRTDEEGAVQGVDGGLAAPPDRAS